jgi:GTP pyrophosphokinase
MTNKHSEAYTAEQLLTRFSHENTTEQEFVWLKSSIEHALLVKDDNPTRPNSVEIAIALETIQVDEVTLISALMSSPLLEDNWPEERLKTEFNDKIAALVLSVRWLNNFKGCTDKKNLEAVKPEQAERVRRMILSIVEDVRAVLIKLAYRLKRLRYLPQDSFEARKCIAQETLDIYTPLANRLGIAQFKWEMEDLAFRYLNPQAYKYIAKSLEEKRPERERYVQDFVSELSGYLKQENIKVDIVGRPKHIYSIWKKMQRKQLDIHNLYDMRAVRVLVNVMPQCYLVLGVAHQHWQPITQEFDDYISHPKPNGYSSLHTAVIGPEGKAVEIQIRTHKMHEHAEMGFAAHWMYKEGGEQDDSLQESINALRNLLDKQDNDEELLESFNQDLFDNRVFIFTPDGEVQELPKGSTPIDFAYRIHTGLGNKCRGALINGKIVALTTVLKNGDQVEILTKKNPQPSRDWMHKSSGYVFSARTRTKIRNWFNVQDKEKHLDDGKVLYEKELARQHIELEDKNFFVDKFSCENLDALFIKLGKGSIQGGKLTEVWNRDNKVAELPRALP